MAPSLLVMTALILRVSLVIGFGIPIAGFCRRQGPASRHNAWLVTLGGTVATGLMGGIAAAAGWEPGPGELWLGRIVRAGSLSREIAAWCFTAWILGVVVISLRMWRQIISANRMSARARFLTDAGWCSLLEQAIDLIRPATAVELKQSAEIPLPLTWGIRRPVIVIPAACADWPAARRRAVLLHELAHVKRRDCAIELLVGLIGAVYWFHPGIWWAIRCLRRAREEACDQAVVAAGVSASGYARELVAILRAAVATRHARLATPELGGASGLEQRIRSLARLTHLRQGHRAGNTIVLIPFALGLVLALWGPTAGTASSPRAPSAAHHAFKAKCACPVKHPASIHP